MIQRLEPLTTFLFKYPPEVFERGRFILAWAPQVIVVVLVIAAIGIPVVATYRRPAGRATRRDRVVLAGIRAGILLVLCFCLADPALELSSAVPQRNFVAILLDDSRSMSISDQDGEPRGTVMTRLFAPESTIGRALGARFHLRYFRFGAGSGRVEDPSGLRFDQPWSRLTPALVRTRDAMSQVPLAGIVVVTDGAENSGVSTDSLEDVLPQGVPVYTVGLGTERFQRDLEISAVESPARALEGSTVAVDVMITQTGFAGRTVRLQAEENGRILAARDVTLDRDGSAAPVRLFVPAPPGGLHTLRFAIPPAQGEVLADNNAVEAMLQVDRGPEKILYYEGEPRYELKFLRRAIENDPALQLVTLLRTADRKYLRLGVSDSLELAAGFPDTREELFQYRAVILGSVEASAFSAEQLRMLEDFVRERGGGLLALGGRRALAEGGYTGTPLARVLPVSLAEPDTGYFNLLQVSATPAGAQEPVLQLGSGADVRNWSEMPRLSSVNRIGAPKPGATVLLTGTGDAGRQPVLAWQRFGRGKAVAFPVQDSWIWQMDAAIGVDDQTHETFWRQLLRWLVTDVPERTSATVERDRVPPGEPVRVAVEVRNREYNAVNDARVTARVTAPSGQTREYVVPWSGRRDGEYHLNVVPEESGSYDVTVTSVLPRQGDTTVAGTAFVAGDSRQEMVNATLQAARLRQIAQSSGGKFYTRETVSSLPDDIAIGGGGITVREVRDLWDMPAIFLLLVGMLAGEWSYRRWRGLI